MPNLKTCIATIFLMAAGCQFAMASSGAPDPIKQGDDYIIQDRVNDAIDSYSNAVKVQPKSSTAHQRLGRAYTLARNYDDAATELRHSVQLDPSNAQAHTDLGWVYGLLGDYSAAITEERAAISIDPNTSADPYLNMGVALSHFGSYKDASDSFRAALAIEPDNLQACVDLAAALAKQQRYKEAKVYYEKALKGDSSDVLAHIGLAGVMGHLGDLQSQVKELKSAVKLAPKSATTHGRLGWALYQIGDYKGAVLEGLAANGLRMEKSSPVFVGTLITAFAATFLGFGVLFGAMFTGARFKPKADETVVRSFFLVFYKDRPGRFVITSRRLVFVPEAFSAWFGATRLSFEHVDVQAVHGTEAARGGRVSVLCSNGSVYHFAMPQLVMEPMIEELKKIRFIGDSAVVMDDQLGVHASHTQLAVIAESQIHLATLAKRQEMREPDPLSDDTDIVTVVGLPAQPKDKAKPKPLSDLPATPGMESEEGIDDVP